METFFGIPTGRLALTAAGVLVVVFGALAYRAARWPIFLRLGVRQLPRRPAQTALIVSGVMLSTALVAASLSTGDTITHSLRAAAVAEVGRLDEVVSYSNVARAAPAGAASESPFTTITFFPLDVYERVRARVAADDALARDVAGMAPGIWLDCTLLNLSRHQASGASVRALPPDYDRVFGELVDRAGQPLSLAALRPGEAFLNDAGGSGLAASLGDELSCTIAGVPHRWRVAGIAAPQGLGAGAVAGVLVPLAHLQDSLGAGATRGVPRPINQIWIANRGDAVTGGALTNRVSAGIRPLLVDPDAVRELRALLGRGDLRAALAARRATLPERTQTALAELLTATDATGAAGAAAMPSALGRARTAQSDALERALRSSAVRTAILAAARTVPDEDLLDAVEQALQGATGFQVFPLKQQVLEIADRAGNVITTIFLLFSLLSIAAGLLLVFLIFALLAASRRSELGIARALGTGRGHLVAMFTFEGVAYALLAVAAGVPAGLGVSRALVAILVRAARDPAAGFSGAGARIAETVTWHTTPASVALAGALGLLLTVATVAIAAWRVSRVTIVTAIRDLPEPPPARPSHHQRWWLLLLPLGLALAALGVRLGQTFPFALAVTGLMLWLGALVQAAGSRWLDRSTATRLAATVAGTGIAGCWALPFDSQQWLGLPQLESGIEIFGLAGVLMVAGATWALVANGSLVLGVLLQALTAAGRAAPALRLAAAQLLRHPFRTGTTAAMFAMVMFMLTVMQVITASATHFHSDVTTVYGGWDLIGQAAASVPASPLSNVPGDRGSAAGTAAGSAGPVTAAEAPRAAGATGTSEAAPPAPRRGTTLVDEALRHPELQPLIEAAGVRTSAFFTLLELSAPLPAWGGYTVAAVDEGFARGNRIPLQTRVRDYATDRAAWDAVARGEQLAIIDAHSLPSPQLRGRPTLAAFSFAFHAPAHEQPWMEPVSLWIGNPAGGGAATKVTVIGVIDRRASQAFRGLHVSPQVLSRLGPPLRPPAVRYYFRIRPGADENVARAALGAAFFDEGIQTTSLAERFRNESGPLILASRLLQLFVGLGLFVGVAALAVISTRAAVERRQQIGILRAIGFSRAAVGTSLLLESTLLVVLGSGLGISLGLVLCRNVFGVQFFDRFQQGMRLVVPWEQLLLTAGITCLVALAATWLPARQAARIPPMAALRAE